VKLLLLIHQYLPEHVGGTEVYLRGIAVRMKEAGHDIHIVSCLETSDTAPGNVSLSDLVVEGIPVTRLCFNLGAMQLPARAEYDNPECGRAVAAVIERFQPDIAHFLHPMKLSGAAIDACIDAGVPTVVTLSDFWAICPNGALLRPDDSLCRGPGHPLDCLPCTRLLHGFPRQCDSIQNIWHCLRDTVAVARRNRRLQRVLLRTDAIVTLSPFQKELLAANGYPAHRILVDRHGVCTRQLRGFSRSSRKEALRVGAIASPVRYKGIHLLLEALTRIPEAPIELLLYLGEKPPSTPFAAGLLRQAGNDSRVRLMGGFHPDDFGRILGGLDVLAVPSIWHENEPFVIKAALYCGIPVMATDLPPLNSLVTPGRNGWLAAPEPGAWAETLTVAQECDQLPDAAGSWTLNMDNNARFYEDLYNRIVCNAEKHSLH